MRTKRFGFLLSVVVILVMAFGAALISGVSEAATIIVTPSAPDELSNNGSCSLREAITNINNGATTWADCVPNIDPYGTYDTIYLRAGTYTTAISGADEDLNASGDYDIRRSVTIAGDGASVTTINGGGLDRVFHIIQGGHTVWISGVTITNGHPAGTSVSGGGIENDGGTLTVVDSIITGNSAGSVYGGGIYKPSMDPNNGQPWCGSVYVINSTISNNTSFIGGGIAHFSLAECGVSVSLVVSKSTISGNTATYAAGGIYNVGGTLAVNKSTISGNATSWQGGGIFQDSGTLSVDNSTISNNTSYQGGGIYTQGYYIHGTAHTAFLQINDSTISANSSSSGAAIENDYYSTTTLRNSIVAKQTAGPDCSSVTPLGYDLSIITMGYNLSSDASCGFTRTGDMQNTNPLLGALADNGGPTQTMALLAGSPAIDTGGCYVSVDQRGVSRPQGNRCDIGAYEFVPCTYTISPTSQAFTSTGGTGSVTVTASSGSCTWTATSSLSWVATIMLDSGTGSGTAGYLVSANTTGASRTGNITIAGKTFVITQSDTAFADVLSTNVFYSYINAIYNAGITVGCSQNPLMYCPDASVTRGQMAAFIIRAKYGENFTYTQAPYFSDVPATNAFFKYVQKMKDTGITTVTGTYDVNGTVTRGQMAAFIIRAKYGENFTYTQTPYFSDVPATNGFFKYVQKMKDDAITTVTGTYGVNDAVTRGQMAAFIARAFLNMR